MNIPETNIESTESTMNAMDMKMDVTKLDVVTSSDQSNCHSSVDSDNIASITNAIESTVSSSASEIPPPVLVTTESGSAKLPTAPSLKSPQRFCRMKKEISNDYNAGKSPKSCRGRGNGKLVQSSLTPVNGLPCLVHTPSLEELQRLTFSDYVRSIVLPAAAVDTEDSDASSSNETTMKKAAPLSTSEPMVLKEGIAKIRLPPGFFTAAPYGKDTTGRGPAWEAGTVLGDRLFHSPIAQHIRGMAGVYEYTHTELAAMTLAQFRDRADQYRIQQVGSAFLEFKKEEDDTALDCEDAKMTNPKNSEDSCGAAVPSTDTKVDPSKAVTAELTDDQIALLERQFWKRLSPTMPPAIYGADEAGSLFGDDTASGWSLGNLDSCLHVLPDIPGVTSPYLYAGMWASVFCAHAEDMNLLSINYLHAGQPKIWYAVAERDAARFVSLAEHHFAHQLKKCKEFLRHKRCLLSPSVLQKAGIRYQTAVQYPGDAIITFPGGFHFGFNAGFNIAEATNFGVLEWLPFGRRAKVCLCRPDSVRIDMNRLTVLLQRYQIDCKRNKRLTWKEWRKRLERKDAVTSQSSIEETEDEIIEVISYATKKRKRKSNRQLSEQQRKNEFWIEVTLPAQLRKTPVVANNKKKSNKSKLSNPWFLARPVGRKRLEIQTKVLCLVPAPSNVAETTVIKDFTFSSDEADLEDEPLLDVDANVEEICFTGTIVDIADGHALIHFDGQGKADDIWMPLSSPKLFLNGGEWKDEPTVTAAVVVSDDVDKLQSKQGTSHTLPPLHFWKEMDSNEMSSNA